MNGPGPDEQIVSIPTKSGGEEEVILPNALVRDDTVEVGRIGGTADSVLIELPQESTSGTWRLWVDPRALVA